MDAEAAKEHFLALSDERVEFVQPEKGDKPLDTNGVLDFCDKHIAGVAGIFLNHWAWCPDMPVFEKAGLSLKAVATPSAGYDHVPVRELNKRGVKVANAADGLVHATAQTGFILALWAIRDFKAHERLVSSGEWCTTPHPGMAALLGLGLEGKTVGILGMGRLGQLLIPLFEPWRIKRVIYTTSKPGKAIRKDVYGHVKNAQMPVEVAKDVDELARESDVLFLCCNLDDSTRHLVNDAFLAKMKKTAVLVNIGRGGIVNTHALLEALKREAIYGAGLDVIENEWSQDVEQYRELIDHPRCVVLPHVGSAIGRNRVEAVGIALNNLVKGALGKQMDTEVSL